jgi:hypothetical protein
MNRLPPSRLIRIFTWTGAALAWGTTVVMAKAATPAKADDTQTEPAQAAAGLAGATAPFPTPPSQGLVILRYAPVTAPAPQVRTIYVQGTANPVAGTAAAPAEVAAASAPAAAAAAPVAVAPPPPPAPTPTTAPPAPTSTGS